VLSYSNPFPALMVALFVGFSGLDLYVPGPAWAALLLLALVRIGVDAVQGKPFDWGCTSFRIGLAVLLVAALTSLTVARSTLGIMTELRNIGLGLGLYVAISQLADRPSRLVTAFAVLALALGVASLLPLRGMLATGGVGSLGLALLGRVGGEGSDPNIHAGEVNSVLPLLVVGIGRLHGWRRWVLVALVPVFVGSVILSQSRAGVAVLALVLLLLVVRASRRVRIVALLGVLVLGGVVLALPTGYWVRFVSIGQLQQGIVVDRSLLLRQHVLHAGWDIFRHHPWLGVGLGSFPTYAPRYMLGAFKAHNSYLEVAAELGVLGIAAYLVWTGSAIAMAWGAARRWRAAGARADQTIAEGLVIGLLAFYITALTLSIEYSLVLWTLIGLANGARRCAAAQAATVPRVP
jgi:putative inorganic carbon (hco3(-)) transporter